ncbi:hypothetical protein SEVIR_3G160000v4 [Setaria viridis]|uniref:Uncharacterized protein n=1 Tax=Setaria viridis TaxID=4556 RepID=A0A4U6VBM8_SETVI|nr:hypothetical protein SEVIR_3G160000v2 [Setaria viridis]
MSDDPLTLEYPVRRSVNHACIPTRAHGTGEYSRNYHTFFFVPNLYTFVYRLPSTVYVDLSGRLPSRGEFASDLPAGGTRGEAVYSRAQRHARSGGASLFRRARRVVARDPGVRIRSAGRTRGEAVFGGPTPRETRWSLSFGGWGAPAGRWCVPHCHLARRSASPRGAAGLARGNGRRAAGPARAGTSRARARHGPVACLPSAAPRVAHTPSRTRTHTEGDRTTALRVLAGPARTCTEQCWEFRRIHGSKVVGSQNSMITWPSTMVEWA